MVASKRKPSQKSAPKDGEEAPPEQSLSFPRDGNESEELLVSPEQAELSDDGDDDVVFTDSDASGGEGDEEDSSDDSEYEASEDEEEEEGGDDDYDDRIDEEDDDEAFRDINEAMVDYMGALGVTRENKEEKGASDDGNDGPPKAEESDSSEDEVSKLWLLAQGWLIFCTHTENMQCK
jgi:hypothetical protein